MDADGTLMFGDGYGETWRVYDRRSGERRSGPLRAHSGYYRAFVNSAGDEWRCLLAENEIIDETTVALEQQLARAVRHSRGPGR